MHDWRSLLYRAGRLNPMVADGLLGAFLLVIALPQLFVQDPAYRDLGYSFRGGDWLGVLLLACETLTLSWRRRHPLIVLGVSTASAAALLLVGFPPTVADLAMVVATYSMAAHSPRRTAIIGGAAFMVALGGLLVLASFKYPHDAPQPQEYAVNFATFAFAWFLGVLQRGRHQHTAELERLNRQLASERESRARWAVAEERSRIARELHDVIAHAVSVMVVQAGAARRVADSRPDQAKDAMTLIESTGRQALAEMRGLVGVLRDVDEPTTLDPQPRLGDVATLVERSRAAGLDVTLEVTGEPRPLPTGIDLSAYRIVQEALTNVRKHAGPAMAEVRVRYGTLDLQIEVVDDGRGPIGRPLGSLNGNGDRGGAGSDGGSDRDGRDRGDRGCDEGRGNGLIGMRERVVLYGGRLEVGPMPPRGFRVLAHLPLERGAG
jgi:signal transduction histidine kinase